MKCSTCPRPGGPCFGETLPHLCGRPDYRAYLETADPLAPMAATPRFEPPSPLVPLSVARRIHHCPHKGPPCTPCGSFATCEIGKGNGGVVAYQDCVECRS